MPYKCRHTIVYLMRWKPTFETGEWNQREVVSAEYWSRRRDLNPRPADYETRAGAKPALSSSAYLRVTALPADTFTRESLVT